MKTIATGAALAASIGLASPALAATATFDFSTSPGDSLAFEDLPASLGVSDNGLSATVYGMSFEDGIVSDATLRSGRIGRYSGGLGVVNSPGDNDHQVDSRGWGDFVELVFPFPVVLSSVDFDLVGRNDDFRWLYDSNNDGRIDGSDAPSGEIDIPGGTVFSGFGGVGSRAFGIAALDSRDEWKLRSATVEYVPPGNVETSEVPVRERAAARRRARRIGFLGWRKRG